MTSRRPRQKIGRLAAKTVKEYGFVARRYLGPVLGSRRVADVTRQDVERLVDRLTGPQRNRVLAFTSRVFSLAERWEWREQRSNPVRGVERAREEPRDRVLAPAELAALAGALDNLAERFPASAAAIRVTATTGLRIGEVIAIQWEHVDSRLRPAGDADDEDRPPHALPTGSHPGRSTSRAPRQWLSLGVHHVGPRGRNVSDGASDVHAGGEGSGTH